MPFMNPILVTPDTPGMPFSSLVILVLTELARHFDRTMGC